MALLLSAFIVDFRPNSRDRTLVEEVAILFREVRLGLLDSESETETRPVPNVDEAVFDHWIRQTFFKLFWTDGSGTFDLAQP